MVKEKQMTKKEDKETEKNSVAEERDYSFKRIHSLVFSRSNQQKEKGLYKKTLRWLSIPFVKVTLYLPISPNMVSFVGAMFNVLSFIPFALGEFYWGIFGVLMLYLAELSDYVDGPIARVKKQFSTLPAHFLTHFYHQGSLSLIFIGLALGIFKNTHQIIYLYLGFAASFFHLFTMYILEMRKSLLLEYEYEQFKDAHDGSSVFVENKKQRFILKVFVFPMVHLRSIILIAFLATLIHPNPIKWIVLFYGLFMPFRAILFYGNSYFNLKKTENKNKKVRDKV